MTNVAPQISIEDARRRFARRSWFAALRPGVRRESMRARVERVERPYYRIALRVELAGRPASFVTTVNADDGAFALLASNALTFREDAAAPKPDVTVARNRAVHLACEGLQQHLVRARGVPIAVTPPAVESVELFGYPYWVRYVTRRGAIDIDVLDAVTGAVAGAKVKLTILNAFVGGASPAFA